MRARDPLCITSQPRVRKLNITRLNQRRRNFIEQRRVNR